MPFVYDISIKIITNKSYLIEAEDAQMATDKALEKAIAEHAGADVWAQGVWMEVDAH